MAKRVPASEKTSEQIEDLLAAGVSGEKDIRSELIRLGMKKILEEAEAAKRKGQGKEDAEAVDSDEQEVLPQQRADFEQEESSDDEVFV